MNKKILTRNRLAFAAFVAPALVFYIIFMGLPMFSAIIYSFTNWNGIRPVYRFVGISNYIEAFTEDVNFFNSVIFTLKFTLVVVIIQNFLALIIALFINYLKTTRKLFKTIFFLPNMISLVVGSYMFRFVFLRIFPDLGVKLRGVSFLGIYDFFAFLDHSWTADPVYAFWSIVIVSIWSGMGYMIIVYLAAIETVPKELKEQAAIDGAPPLIEFLNVTLPLILPAVTICLFLTINNSFKVFDQVFALTHGEPGRTTETIALNIYFDAFGNNQRLGYGCAKAIILFGMILLITMFQVGLMKRKEIEL